MISEKLTGFIEISINNEKEGGFIFFSNGELVGEFYSGTNKDPNIPKKDLELLFEETTSKGGVFNVSGIPLKPDKNEFKAKEPTPDSSEPFVILEELLVIFENIISSQKKSRIDFSSTLKKKFLEKVSRYEFLDPFSMDFRYANRKISYNGKSNKREVILGVVECVRELARDLNLLTVLSSQLNPWFQKFDREIKQFDIRI
jgi:hypothetical protein